MKSLLVLSSVALLFPLSAYAGTGADQPGVVGNCDHGPGGPGAHDPGGKGTNSAPGTHDSGGGNKTDKPTPDKRGGPIKDFIDRIHKEGEGGWGSISTGKAVEPSGFYAGDPAKGDRGRTFGVGISVHFGGSSKSNCVHEGTPPDPTKLPPGMRKKTTTS